MSFWMQFSRRYYSWPNVQALILLSTVILGGLYYTGFRTLYFTVKTPIKL